MTLEQKYYSRQDAAVIMGFSLKTTDRLIKKGLIKARKLNAATGGRVLISIKSINDLLHSDS